MLLKKSSDINSVRGNEGTIIKQYFHPKDTNNEISYSLAQFTLESEEKSKLHKIKSSEIYYILQGVGNLEINKEQFHLKKDDSMYTPANSEQFIENTGTIDLVFLCIVEPAWKIEDEIILE
jgi:mannose-6-phosphate isomerase-like protein (cupin superfamily)